MLFFKKKFDAIVDGFKKEAMERSLHPLLSYYDATIQKVEYDPANHFFFYLASQNDHENELPVVFMIHGGFWSQGAAAVDNRLALYFASNGFKVVNIEFPQSYQADYKNMLETISKAIHFVLDHSDEYKIDKRNVFLFGNSSGGQIAFALSALASSINLQKEYCIDIGDLHFNAVCLNHPVAFMNHDSLKDNRDQYKTLMICLFKNDSRMRKEFTNPDYFSSDISFKYPPIRIVTSLGDKKYGNNALMLSNMLLNNDCYVELDNKSNVELGHNFNIKDTDSLSSITTNNGILTFFRKFLVK